MNAIAPALIETDMVTANPNATAARIPVGRLGHAGRSGAGGGDARTATGTSPDRPSTSTAVPGLQLIMLFRNSFLLMAAAAVCSTARSWSGPTSKAAISAGLRSCRRCTFDARSRGKRIRMVGTGKPTGITSS